MARRPSILASLDIGSQKIGLLVAERTEKGVEILGVGSAPSRGMQAGRVTDVEKTTQAISVALGEAEVMSGCQIRQVTVGVSGDHVRGTNSHGVVAIDNGEVTARAARAVIEAAQAVPLPADQRVLHLMCRDYAVDGQGGIVDPVGMNGVRLEANLHVVSGCESALANVVKCCNKAGLSVGGMIAESLASAEAVIEPEEKEMGVALIDIGAGTTDVCVYAGQGVVHSFVIPVGGLHVTRDLARVLETSMGEAESLKKQHGAANAQFVDQTTGVEVSGVGGRERRVVSCRLVADIMEPRLDEIFEMIGESIIRSGYAELLTAGAVLTGGTAMTPGLVQLAARVLDMPVRLGEPRGLEGLVDEIDDSSWAGAVGLLFGLEQGDLAQPGYSGVASRVVPKWIYRRWKELF